MTGRGPLPSLTTPFSENDARARLVSPAELAATDRVSYDFLTLARVADAGIAVLSAEATVGGSARGKGGRNDPAPSRPSYGVGSA